MADPTQTTGTPGLNPPPPNDPGWLADTPATTDNYDVVIGNGTTTVGFMLNRSDDGASIDRNYKPEAEDYEYAGTFVSRANVGTGYGDDQQDFWMTFTQKDWSGGLGQKYFDPNDPVKNRRYWSTSIGADTWTIPGAAKNAAFVDTVASSTSTAMNHLLLYYVNAAGQRTGQNALVDIASSGTNTVVMKYSTDEGATWATQGVTNASVAIHDMVDGCVGDDGRIYVLEGIDTTTVSSSTIHYINGPGIAASNAWDNTTHLTGTNNANCICYWQGGPGRIYVGTIKGQLLQVPLGGNTTGTVIKDFGAGTIVDILATPKGIYVIYYGAGTGDYRLFLYDGANVSEVAKLPKGWRYPYSVEQQLAYDQTTVTVATLDCLAYQDGVLYVSGLLPSRDVSQGNGQSLPYRQALWFYQSGNSGLIWASDFIGRHYLNVPCGPICAANNQIYVLDAMNNKLMCYDPAGGGMHVAAKSTLFSQNSQTSFTAHGTAGATVTIPSTSYVSTLTTTEAYGVGTIVRNASRAAHDAIVVGVTSNTVKTYVIQQGYTSQGQAGFVQWNNGDNLSFAPPSRIIGKLNYDIDHGTFAFLTQGTVLKPGGAYGVGGTSFVESNDIDVLMVRVRTRTLWSVAGAGGGEIITSLFDFGSSYDKYFRDVMWDGSLSQGLTYPWTEQAGKVTLYYKLNDTTDRNESADSGVVLIQDNAQPRVRYPINVTGKSMCLIVIFRAATTATEFASTGVANCAPIVRKISLRAAPIVPTYRYRNYQIALFQDMPLKQSGQLEPRTPAQLRKNLETLLSANTPLTVSDSGVTSMTAMFDPDKCKIREVRPNEYVAYIAVREI